MNARATLVLFVLASGCRVQEVERSSHPPPAPVSTTAEPTAPLLLTVEGPATVGAGQEISIVVRLDRRPATGDVKIQVALPAGVELVDGTTAMQLTQGDGPTPSRTLRVRFANVPTTDLVVDADASGPGWAAHARKFYRFGRPEPMLPDPGASLTPAP